MKSLEFPSVLLNTEHPEWMCPTGYHYPVDDFGPLLIKGPMEEKMRNNRSYRVKSNSVPRRQKRHGMRNVNAFIGRVCISIKVSNE